MGARMWPQAGGLEALAVALCLLGLVAHQVSRVQAQDWVTIAKALDPGNQILGDWQNNQNPCGQPPFTVRETAA